MLYCYMIHIWLWWRKTHNNCGLMCPHWLADQTRPDQPVNRKITASLLSSSSLFLSHSRAGAEPLRSRRWNWAPSWVLTLVEGEWREPERQPDGIAAGSAPPLCLSVPASSQQILQMFPGWVKSGAVWSSLQMKSETLFSFRNRQIQQLNSWEPEYQFDWEGQVYREFLKFSDGFVFPVLTGERGEGTTGREEREEFQFQQRKQRREREEEIPLRAGRFQPQPAAQLLYQCFNSGLSGDLRWLETGAVPHLS